MTSSDPSHFPKFLSIGLGAGGSCRCELWETPKPPLASEQLLPVLSQIWWFLAWQHGGTFLGLEGSPILVLSRLRYRPAWHALQFPDPWCLVLCLVLECSSK